MSARFPRPSHFLLCFLLGIVFFVPVAGYSVGIMVNEYKNSNGNVAAGTKMTSDEFLEFVLTTTATATDLANLTFGDSNDTTSALVGMFSFQVATLHSVLSSAGLSAFLPGTIIVVKGNALGAENLSYNPLAGGGANDDAWSIELVAGQGARGITSGSIDIDERDGYVGLHKRHRP
jgi:hypothetical protein